ncbi:DUF1801 domain-containing protein [Larkinella harenae]
MTTSKPADIDEYIAGCPEAVQPILQEIRLTIKNAVPEAEETISYAMPTFRLNNSVLVHFAAFKNHIGFYATPTGHEAFQQELSGYHTGKGSVQFPLDQPMPLNLITRMVEFRAKENRVRSTAQPKKA